MLSWLITLSQRIFHPDLTQDNIFCLCLRSPNSIFTPSPAQGANSGCSAFHKTVHTFINEGHWAWCWLVASCYSLLAFPRSENPDGDCQPLIIVFRHTVCALMWNPVRKCIQIGNKRPNSQNYLQISGNIWTASPCSFLLVTRWACQIHSPAALISHMVVHSMASILSLFCKSSFSKN